MAPAMPRTAIDICNRALDLVGAERVSSFDDETAEAISCSTHYEPTLQAALTAPGGKPFRWSFAKTQRDLTRMSDTPVARFSYAWQIPNDVLEVHAVLVNDRPITFDRLDDMIYCDADEGVVLEGTYQPLPENLSGAFVDALAHELAGLFCMSLKENEGQSDRFAQMAQMKWAAARSADSQARTSRRIRANRLRNARFGGPHYLSAR